MKIGVTNIRNFIKKDLFVFAFCFFALPYSHIFAQNIISDIPAKSQAELNREKYRDIINSNTITILGASLSGSYIKIVDDIAKAVNDGHRLRVLPLIGEGGSQNIRDILYLKGVDAGIVMSTSLEAYKQDPIFKNLDRKLHYIARLYDEEFHVIAGKDINSVEDLRGKVVGFHGGAFVSGQLLFDKLNIIRAKSIKINFFRGLEKIKKGEIAAIVRATARPMKGLNKSFDPNFHKLIPVKFNISLAKSYAPAKLSHKDYPNIIAKGEKVPTVTIGVILAAFAHKPNTERYRRVAKFTNAFFNNFQKILENKKRHKKWDEVNLAATLPGWQRFAAARQWINRKSKFKNFLQSKYQQQLSLNEGETENLFRQYMNWEKKVNRR